MNLDVSLIARFCILISYLIYIGGEEEMMTEKTHARGKNQSETDNTVLSGLVQKLVDKLSPNNLE